MGFSRQEYWTGLPFSSPGDLPDPGIEPKSPVLQAEALTSMNTHRHTGIYCRSMTLCNCGSWSSSMCKSVIFPFDVGACGHRTDREGKMTVKYQVQESKSELEPLTQVGSHKDGLNPLDSDYRWSLFNVNWISRAFQYLVYSGFVLLLTFLPYIWTFSHLGKLAHIGNVHWLEACTLKKIVYFLAVLSLCCCEDFPLVSVSMGYSPVVVPGLLTVVASHFGAWAVGHAGLSCCGSWTLEQAQGLWCTVLIAPLCVASSGIRDWICVSCIGSRGLYFKGFVFWQWKGEKGKGYFNNRCYVRWFPLFYLSFAVLLSDLKTICLRHLFFFNKRSHALSFNNPVIVHF